MSQALESQRSRVDTAALEPAQIHWTKGWTCKEQWLKHCFSRSHSLFKTIVLGDIYLPSIRVMENWLQHVVIILYLHRQMGIQPKISAHLWEAAWAHGSPGTTEISELLKRQWPREKKLLSWDQHTLSPAGFIRAPIGHNILTPQRTSFLSVSLCGEEGGGGVSLWFK